MAPLPTRLRGPGRAPARPGLLTRVAAWLVTGPLGHLAGGAIDLAALVAHLVGARARGRDPWP